MRYICPKCQNYMEYTFDENNILINECIKCGYSEDIDNELFKENKNLNSEKIKVQMALNKLRGELKRDNDRLIVVSYLRSIRESRGLSQQQMADFFDFSVQRYGNVERNYNAPSIVLICQFAHVLNTELSNLFKTMQVSNQMYEEMKHLKIQKTELIENKELIHCENELKKLKFNDPNYKEFIKRYNTLSNSKDALLKQGDVIEDVFWEKFIELKDDEYLKNNIRNYMRQ